MKNVHSRRFAVPIERLRPFIEACWSAGPDDPFPRDVLPTWRKNPPDRAPGALVPGVTFLGHGPFRFRLTEWDGRRWRVEFGDRRSRGWHGFDLEEEAGGCRVTHTLVMHSTPVRNAAWSIGIEPIHDWAVEAIFDRIEEALSTGTVPAVTTRPMPRGAAVPFALLNAVLPLRKRLRTMTMGRAA